MASSSPSPEAPYYDRIDPLAIALRLALSSLADKTVKETLYAADIGLYRGRALQVLLAESAASGMPIKWMATDTFNGLPALTDKDRELAPQGAPYLQRPMFDDTTVREVVAFLEPTGQLGDVDLIEGPLEEVLAGLPDRKYLFVNISAKLYRPHTMALDYFYDRMLPGGVILFDDIFNRRFPMAEAAIEAFMDNKQEQIFQLTGNDANGTVKRGFIMRRG